MGLIRWLLGDTGDCVAGHYTGNRSPLGPPGGMFADPAQTPAALMEPSVQPGQPDAPETPGFRAASACLLPGRRIARTVEVTGSVMVDVDADGCPVRVRMLDGSDWTRALASLALAGRLRIV